MRRLLVLAACASCSAAPTAPCHTVVKPVLVAIFTWRDKTTGAVVHVDSIYSKVDVLADTVRVCE